MNLRVDGSSIRFRVDRQELERLRDEGTLETVTPIPAASGDAALFRFGIRRDPERSGAEVTLQSFEIELALSAAEVELLCRDDREGVYVDREWSDDDGRTRRLRILVEKDRKAPGWDATAPWVGPGAARGGR